MVLTFTGSIAATMPFTSQIIMEMKGNVGSKFVPLQNKVNLTRTELQRLYNIIYYMGQVTIGSTTIFAATSGLGIPAEDCYWQFNEPMGASETPYNFEW